MKIVSKGWDSLQTGYTEKVNLTEGAKFNSNSESGTPLLWLFSRDKRDLSLEIPFGLIRGRSLDVFDGAGWSIGFTPIAQLQAPFNRKNSGPILVVDAIRAPSSFPSLPVPYGTFRVFSGTLERNSFARHFEGDWVDPLSTRMQAHYTFAFEPQALYLEGQTEMDKPRPIQMSVPKQLYTKRIKMLLSNLFKPKDTEKEKVRAIADYFHAQSFYATLDSKPVDEINRNLNVARMQPLERFLFISKEGNCEWFATASAMLLRMAGVPTRLVAGFRITKGPVAGVLSVRSSDAHAWVEYWSKTSGWIPFDPTPRVISPPSFSRMFSDAYEMLSNYWYRSILSYSTGDVDNGPEPSANEPKLNQDNGVFAELRQWRQFFLTKMGVTSSFFLKLLFTMMALVVGTYVFLRHQYPWLFSIRHRFRMGNRDLWKERLKMEKLIRSRALARVKEFHDVSEFKNILPHPLVMRWIELYLEVRFGRTELKPKQAIGSLAQVRKELYTTLQSV